MIFFVETNFVLELAYGQEEHASCRALVDLAGGNDALSLVLPAYCVGEAYERQIRRQREREALQRRLAAELGELSRSPTHAGRLEEVGEVTALLAESAEEERRRLESVLAELYATATLVPLDKTVAQEAHRQERRRGLGPQDALVYASVLGYLRRSGGEGSPAGRESCFVTRDNDFADEDVRTDLAELGCKLLFRFEDALGYVRSWLS